MPAMVAGLLSWGVLIGGCRDGGDPPTAPPLETWTPTIQAEPTPTEEPQDVPPERLSCEERVVEGERLTQAVERALEGYDGTYGFALYDLECERIFAINREYQQYPASASKIISIVAVMRAVDERRVDFEDVDPIIREVFLSSSDSHADLLDTYVSGEELSETLALAGVSDLSSIRDEWRYTNMTAPDMALFWAAIVRGQLMSGESTEYVLELAGTPDIPPALETFPGGSFEREGYQWGQKAGYYVSDGIPYFLVGAGFLRPTDRSWDGIVPVVFLRTTVVEFNDPQRRLVWPLVLEYLDAVVRTGAS